MNESFFEKLNIGAVLSFSKLEGGITNEVYLLSTSTGKYIIKVLCECLEIDNKSHYDKIENSEVIASLASLNGVHAVHAIPFNDKYIQDIEDKKVLIYPYINGSVKLSKEITTFNVRSVAKEQALLHNIKVDDIYKKTYSKNNYEYYLNLLKDDNNEYSKYFNENYDYLIKIYEKVYNSYLNLNEELTYVHKDLNRKNILWEDEVPYIIDWETSEVGYPSIDFFNSAYFMSHDVEIDKYKAYVEEYLSIRKIDTVNGVYAGLIEELNWLYFSLSRLFSDNFAEIELGKESIIPSIDNIIAYYEKIPLMNNIIKNIF